MAKKIKSESPVSAPAAVEAELETPFSPDGTPGIMSPGGDGAMDTGTERPQPETALLPAEEIAAPEMALPAVRAIGDMRFQDAGIIYQLDIVRNGLYILRMVGKVENDPV